MEKGTSSAVPRPARTACSQGSCVRPICLAPSMWQAECRETPREPCSLCSGSEQLSGTVTLSQEFWGLWGGGGGWHVEDKAQAGSQLCH